MKFWRFFSSFLHAFSGQCCKQPFSENCVQIGASVRLEFCLQEFRTHRQTDRHTDTPTNCNENITPPRFRGGVKKERNELSEYIHAQRKISLTVYLELVLWCAASFRWISFVFRTVMILWVYIFNSIPFNNGCKICITS